MQKDHPLFSDFAKMMGTAAGVAQAAGDEAKAVMRTQADVLALELDLVRKEDLQILEDRIAALEARLDELEQK